MPDLKSLQDLPPVEPVEMDDQDQSFMEAAALADRGEMIPTDLISEKPEGQIAESVSGEQAAEPEIKVDERPRDLITGKFIKTEAEEATTKPVSEAVGASKTTSESEYERKVREKKEKETARLDKTWENVNKQKEEIEQRRRDLDQREQQVRQQIQQPRPVQKRDYSSQQLFEAHQDFRVAAKKALEAGDYDEFNRNDDLADKAFENAGQFYQLEQEEAQQVAHQKHSEVWNGHIKDAFKSDPDLANAESDLSKTVNQILEQSGKELWMFPDGFKKAVEIAKLRISAADAPFLLEANKRLKAENDRLTGLTSISGSGPTGAPAKKDFNSMSDEEQDAHLARRAQEVDHGQG